MRPTKWIVQWSALGDVQAGSKEFTQRHLARGFYIVRKASGFAVSITPGGFV